jgi:hypothetical protein
MPRLARNTGERDKPRRSRDSRAAAHGDAQTARGADDGKRSGPENTPAGPPPLPQRGSRLRRTLIAVLSGLFVTVVGGILVVEITGGPAGPPVSAASSTSNPPTATGLPPLPKRTYPETGGGPVHTWSDATTGEGTQGPLVASGRTIRVGCKVTGLRVTDGDSWWYRIASKPWSGGFFASADGFYNNGRTSGTLHHTPLVDPRVPVC